MTSDGNDLLKALQEKQAQKAQAELDLKQITGAFAQMIQELYRQIELCIQPLRQGGVTCKRSSHTLYESWVNSSVSYQTEKLEISHLDSRITITPVGRLIVGAKGRVDVRSPVGEERFMVSAAPETLDQWLLVRKDPKTKKEIAELVTSDAINGLIARHFI